jgi:hypothetical protein
VADLPRAYVDFNFLGTLKAPRGRLELFTRLPRGGIEELRGQGIEPSDGLRLTLYDLDAEDGTPTFLEADGELFWDADRGEWLAAFEKGGFRTVPRAG